MFEQAEVGAPSLPSYFFICGEKDSQGDTERRGMRGDSEGQTPTKRRRRRCLRWGRSGRVGIGRRETDKGEDVMGDGNGEGGSDSKG